MSESIKLVKDAAFKKWRTKNLEHHRAINREARRILTGYYENLPKKLKRYEQSLVRLETEYQEKMRKLELRHKILVDGLEEKIRDVKEEIK